MSDLTKPLQILEIIGPVDDHILEHYFTIITNHGTFRIKMDINSLYEIDFLAEDIGHEKARIKVFAKKLEEAMKETKKELPDKRITTEFIQNGSGNR